MKFNPLRRSNETGIDPAAFVAVYDQYSEALLRYFARRTLDPEVAFDLTAETFAAAFATRERFDPARGDEAAWLYGIARHQLGSYLRRLQVESRARERLGLPNRPLASGDHERIEEMIDFASVGRQVRSALEDLPAEQREAVVYRVIDELSYTEIAERAGCSEDAARARVSRGLRLLARTLTLPDEDIERQGAHP
ncbi:MAG TPA: RNA polymerase sigma factor [Gaiellales bacterium]|nr:RNA polymerase sigma factor [Gaiellales bacterium]